MEGNIHLSGSTNTPNESATPTPFEELEIALEECKFGRFHIRFLCSLFMGVIANVLVTANTAFLLPNAECDLGMTMNQKGILNAMTYCGMLTCGFGAGFLTDTFGRKIFLVYGYFGIFLCCLVQGCSQNYETLLAAKFMEGFIFSAGFNAMIAMMSEVTTKRIRDVVMICSSSFVSFANIAVSLFSWSILPHKWEFVFFDGAFVLKSWNIYLFLCGIFSLLASIMYSFLPESPRFLVAHKRYREVLSILKMIYKENTGKPIDTFKIKSIGRGGMPMSPSSLSLTKDRSLKNLIVTSLLNVKPLFKMPLLGYLVLICVMQLMTMLVYNVLRLWYPQLSTIIEHYSMENHEKGDLCLVLDTYMSQTVAEENITSVETCVPHTSGPETYINSIIMSCVGVVPYIFTATLVSRVGKKMLLFVALAISCGCVSSLGWADSSMTVLALVSTTVALTQTCVCIHQTLVADLFPTVTKSLAISLMMMAGRTGTLTGNIFFPILLAQGCLLPFFTISGFLIGVMVLCVCLPSVAGNPKK